MNGWLNRRARIALLLAMAAVAAPVGGTVGAGAQKWRAGDWAGAIAEWTQPAAAGDADALFNLGQAYRLGRGVPQNLSLAQDYYRRAAAKDHLAATANLGITLYQDGRKTEALQYLRTAADRNEPRAAYVLGVATFAGDGAPRNPTLGYAYMLRARDGGLPEADPQAARMATKLTAGERARGEAAAAALAAGEPVPVDLVGGSVAQAPAAGAASRAPAQTRANADEKPAPAPAAAAGAASSPGRTEAVRQRGWKVQLGAYASEQAARTAWATLVANAGDVLKGRKPAYSPRGRLVRLHVGPFDAQDDARALCQKLSAGGRPCFVTRD